MKSDKYLQFVEAAQVDYLVRTRLFHTLFRDGWRFVNVSQLIKFARPVEMFRRVRIEIASVFADSKRAYFSYDFILGNHKHGEVLVKMNFKMESIKIRPGELIDHAFAAKPACIDTWGLALHAM